LIEKRTLHGLLLTMSTEGLEAAATRDLWLRTIIMSLAMLAALGAGLAWSNLAKSSELQLRLVRASEMNTHLKEMNLAAAGLAPARTRATLRRLVFAGNFRSARQADMSQPRPDWS